MSNIGRNDMNLHGFILALVALALAVPVLRQEPPPLPYLDQGACPFEGCIYREWTAKKAVVAYVEPKVGSPVAFTIKERQVVRAETGFVLTSKAGVTKVVKPITLGYDKDSKDPAPKPLLNLKPGELLYTLHDMGEGFDLFWYKGKVYTDQISSDEPDPNGFYPDITDG